MSSAYGEKPASGRELPYGLMSLWQMVNCGISALGALMAQLMLEQQCHEFDEFHTAEDRPVDEASKFKIGKWMKIAATIADDFEWQAVRDRIEIIQLRLNGKKGVLTNRRLASELGVLRETIDSGLKNQFIYRYPNDRAAVFTKWRTDWASVVQAFPSAEGDIFAGVDLWALKHHTASAFHFMRVLEHGLRTLAKDVGISFDIQNWQNVIDEIEAEIRQIGKNLPRGSEKNERLRFLSEAAKEFVYFKDGWRNYVAHNRANYDEYQSRGILEHVRAFMTTLSSKLAASDGEKPCESRAPHLRRFHQLPLRARYR